MNLLDNTDSDGSPVWEEISRTLMTHRNTPDAELGLSPAQMIVFQSSQGSSLQNSRLIAGRREKMAKTGHVVEDSPVTPQPTIHQDQ